METKKTEDTHERMEFKCVGITGFKAYDGDGDEGLVEAIVSVTGLRDNVKDVIKPGAYEKSLNIRKPKGVWHHTWSESVSRTEGIKELMPGDPELPKTLPNGEPWPEGAGALKVKTRFNLETQRGREAYADVKFFGDQQEWSIGYNVPVGGATIDQKTGVRTIHTLDLYEYSPVLFGAMPNARTSSVKEAQLAYKSLMEDEQVEVEPSDTDDDEGQTDDEVEASLDEFEQGALDLDFGDESKMWGYLDRDGYFTKAAGAGKSVSVSAAQAQKVHKAITSLVELLRDMTIDLEDDGVPMPGAGAAQEAPEGEQEGESQEGEVDFENTSLEDLIGEAFGGDEDAVATAEEFDAAFADGDRDTMESTAEDIISAVESALEDGGDKDALGQIGGYVAWAIEQVGDPEEGEGEESDEPDEEEEEDDEETGGKKTLTPEELAEIKSLLG